MVFQGPSTYVSPHWRAAKTRGGTFDYEEVRVRGIARPVSDIAFFRNLLNDLSSLIEPQYAEVGDYPVWQTTMAPEGYIERLFPALLAFRIEIHEIDMISKLHQNFPIEDRIAVADHLARCHRQDSQLISDKIRQQTKG